MPTLVLDDGRPLGESNAILWYFGDGTAYVPDDAYERAQVLQWMFFEQYSHEPNIAVARFLRMYSGEPERFERQKERLLTGGYAALDAMESRLAGREFLVGRAATRSRTSRSTRTRTSRTRAASSSTAYPAIRAWLERVAAQPGHVTIDA